MKIRENDKMQKIREKVVVLVFILTLLSAGAVMPEEILTDFPYASKPAGYLDVPSRSVMPVQAQTVKAATEGKSSKATLKDVTSAANEVRLKNTKGKNASDVAAIKELLEQLKAQGNDVSGYDDLNLGGIYTWSGGGTLVMLAFSKKDLEGRLVFKGFKNLEKLEFPENNFTKLKVSSCPKLVELYCGHNKLTKLNVSKCPKLLRLDCESNELTKLGVSKCPKLSYLDCGDNNFTKIDLSKYPKLTKLYCYNNKFKELNISKCPELTYLSCFGNELKKLNTSKCPKLYQISADKNLKIPGWYIEHERDSYGSDWKRY